MPEFWLGAKYAEPRTPPPNFTAEEEEKLSRYFPFASRKHRELIRRITDEMTVDIEDVYYFVLELQSAAD